MFMTPAPANTAEPLLVTIGSQDGASMRIRVIGGSLEITRKTGSLIAGRVMTWDRVGVITGARRAGRDGTPETTYRFWLLEPGGAQSRVGLGPFKVEGVFTIRELRNGKAASEAFKALGSGP
jgi:hypothetical protein